jgi:hypothetical protein
LLRDGAAARLLEVLLHECGQFGVHCQQLVLVEADREGQQPVHESAVPARVADQPLARHGLEQTPGSGHVHARAGSDRARGLAREAHMDGQPRLCGREQLGQQPQLDAALGGRKAVGYGVQALGELTVNRFHRCLSFPGAGCLIRRAPRPL